jgi:hypothetical protein
MSSAYIHIGLNYHELCKIRKIICDAGGCDRCPFYAFTSGSACEEWFVKRAEDNDLVLWLCDNLYGAIK